MQQRILCVAPQKNVRIKKKTLRRSRRRDNNPSLSSLLEPSPSRQPSPGSAGGRSAALPAAGSRSTFSQWTLKPGNIIIFGLIWWVVEYLNFYYTVKISKILLKEEITQNLTWMYQHECINMNVSIWMYQYECINMNVSIWMYLYECINMNVSTWMHLSTLNRASWDYYINASHLSTDSYFTFNINWIKITVVQHVETNSQVYPRKEN